MSVKYCSRVLHNSKNCHTFAVSKTKRQTIKEKEIKLWVNISSCVY